MSSLEDHQPVRGGIRSICGLRRFGAASAVFAAVVCFALMARPLRGQLVVANVKVDFRQAANNDSGTCGLSPGHACALGHPHWINSIVQQSNARYFEGMSVPQRVVFQEIADTAGSPKEVHSLSFSHQATKGGVHAYDFLTSWTQAQTAAAAFTPPAGGLLFDLFTDACGAEIGPPSSMTATCTALTGGANCVDVPAPSDPYVDTTDGAYSSRIAAYESVFGPRTIRICGDQPINSASLTICGHSGPDTGDSDINYMLQWNSNSNEIVIEFAGHLAVSGDPLANPVAWGLNQGAAGVSGGPYHFNLDKLGGTAPGCVQTDVTSLGSQDNQIKGADIIFCRPGCADGSTCTNGLCADGGACGSLTCDDQIACTNDSCDEVNSACYYTSNNAKCNDSNECTFNVCDPANPAANADGCVFPPVAENTPCAADNVPCTRDVCRNGACGHVADDSFCNDGAACTNPDLCAPGPGAGADGCVYTPVDSKCDDGVSCTSDSCSPGIGGGADPVTGCVHTTTNCPDDTLFCNGGEYCDALADCIHTGDPCLGTPTPVCCEATDTCVAECWSNADCPDDGLFCNGSEVCVAGVCGHTGNPCAEDACDCTKVTCEEANDTCVKSADPAYSCLDNFFCNGEEYCDLTATGPGTCCAPAGKPCAPPLQCNEVQDRCVGCLSDDKCPDGNFCDGVETCSELTQTCTTSGPDPCPEDAFTCTHVGCNETTDICTTTLDDTVCNDGIACTTDVCDPTNPAANPTTGCVNAPVQAACNDSNVCTNDSCVPTSCTPPCSGCVFAPKAAGFACGNQTPLGVCDNPDICDGMGQCVQNAKPAETLCRAGGECDPPEFCDGTGKDCPANDCTPAGTGCTSDGNECTNDECDGFCHCTHTPKPDQTACSSDGNVCTRDVCQGGECLHSPEPPSTPCGDSTPLGDCDGPDHCNGMGGCDPNLDQQGTLCRLAANECDLTEVCTGASAVCPADVCKPTGSLCPDDGDICTDDECDGFCRCMHPPIDPCGETPGITCPPDKIFECDTVGDFGDPTIEDDCSVNPTVECTEESTPGKLPQERIIIRTCTVTNDCGNTAQCRQRIDIVDTTPPMVTCPLDCTLECGDVQCDPPECNDPSCECGGVATCEDNCSTCTVSVTCEVIPKDCTAGQAAGLTPPPKLTIVKTVTSTDGAASATATGQGNVGTCIHRIELMDTTPPELHAAYCPGTITICRGDELSFTPPTCTDRCGTCDVACLRSDNLPLPGPPPSGPITVTCVASDECGNQSSCVTNVELSESGECFVKIPTVSEWGLVILTLLLLTGAKVFFGRRQVASE